MARSPNGTLPINIKENTSEEMDGLKTTRALNLDVSWTPIEENHFIITGDKDGKKTVSRVVNAYFLSSLSFDAWDVGKIKEDYMKKAVENQTPTDLDGTLDLDMEVKEIPTPSRISRSRTEPEKEMLCFDSLAEVASYTVRFSLSYPSVY